MLGTFQQSKLRIEVDASELAIRDSLVHPDALRTWLWPQTLSAGIPDPLQTGVSFISWLGPIAIAHQVELVESNALRFVLSQGVDGFHQWDWGDGWVQSQLEGMSLLPLNLAQTLSLVRLRLHLQSDRS
jgi:hypothetical protein